MTPPEPEQPESPRREAPHGHAEAGEPDAPRARRPPTPFGLPREQRILRRGHFLHVQGHGRKVHTRHLVILLMPSDAQRFGVTVGKRVGKAHERNRVKRLLRELFRRNKSLFPALCDIGVVARAGAERLDYDALREELLRARAMLARIDGGPPAPKRDPKERRAR